MSRYSALALITVASSAFIAGCGDDDADGMGSGGASTGGSGADGGMGGSGASATGGMGTGAGGGGTGATGAGGGGTTPQTFEVRIENISGKTALPGPLAPGVYALHAAAEPLFTPGDADRGDGLEALAEDGDPTELAASLISQQFVSDSGAFNTPEGAAGPGPAFPGDSYVFTVDALPADGALSFATMLVQSNDLFIAPDGAGIPLFDDAADPIPTRDVTAMLSVWDSGTERNEAPGMGPNQAPRQSAANVGPAEGLISRFVNATRTLPGPSALVDITVVENAGTFSVTVTNVSTSSGAIMTPIAPVFFATHDGSLRFFEPGMPSSAGLQVLAEDGSPADLVAQHNGNAAVGMHGAVAIIDGGVNPGAALGGESFTFDVTPDAAHPMLTFAAMAVASNDAFLAPHDGGIMLLENGNPRAVADIESDIERLLALWDAGSESNEVPGRGANQPPAAGGPIDANTAVRIYSDATNDLAGDMLGGFADVTITDAGGGDFTVTVTNTSGTTAFPGILTPVAWATHDGSPVMYEMGTPASAGLESLAEDGDPSTLVAALGGMATVGTSGAEGGGPIMAGGFYTFTVTPDATNRFLSIASMVVPSNDTFMAFMPGGVALLDGAGAARSNADIAADVLALLLAADAGTETNQAGAAGPDQAPFTAPNIGAPEGNALVRLYDGSIWPAPRLEDLVRVTITPIN